MSFCLKCSKFCSFYRYHWYVLEVVDESVFSYWLCGKHWMRKGVTALLLSHRPLKFWEYGTVAKFGWWNFTEQAKMWSKKSDFGTLDPLTTPFTDRFWNQLDLMKSKNWKNGLLTWLCLKVVETMPTIDSSQLYPSPLHRYSYFCTKLIHMVDQGAVMIFSTSTERKNVFNAR